MELPRVNRSSLRSLSILAVLLLFFCGTAFSFPCSSECGRFTPTEWVNSHISELVAAGVGSPISFTVSSPIQFFQVPGAQNFQGMAGCKPTKLRYQNETARLNYSSSCDLINKQTSDFRQPEDDPYISATFDNLTVVYQTCTLPYPSDRFKGNRVVRKYELVNRSFPGGLRVTFAYDKACRVSSISFWDMNRKENGGDGVATSVANQTLTYLPRTSSNENVWWLPKTTRRQTNNAITTQETTFELDSAKKNINSLNRTITTQTIQEDGSITESSSRESWSFSYNNASLLVSALVKSFDRTGTKTSRYGVVYDSRKRWKRINFTNVDTPENPTTDVFSVNYFSVDRASLFTSHATSTEIRFNY